MRILLVDNFDSFTYNLAHYLAELCGEWPRVVRNDAPLDELCDWRPERVVLSPGPGSPSVPSDVGVCPFLIERLPDTPILGVCLGHQTIATVLGGRVVEAPHPVHGYTTELRHDGAGLFRGLPPSFEVVRYHSLTVDPASLPPSVAVTAWSHDGLVMALSHRERALFGVQFHPESICSRHGRELLANFLGDGNPSVPKFGHGPPPRRRRASPPSTARDRVRRLDGWVDPTAAFHALAGDAPAAYWLDGEATAALGRGRYTYLGIGGPEIVRCRGDRVEVSGGARAEVRRGDPYQILDDLLAGTVAPPPDAPFAFGSGWVGYLGYELSHGVDGPREPNALPDAMLMRATAGLVLDHLERRAWLCRHAPSGEPSSATEAWFDETARRLTHATAPPPTRAVAAHQPPRFRFDRDRARYLRDIHAALDLIRRGETYELCLTNQIRARSSLAPLDLYRVLRATNPAPYAAFLRFPEATLLSSSPERFLTVDESGHAESRPIKGTRRRGADANEDRRLAAELAGSPKDRAENLMIVDLVRNDLGRVCQVGSVTVPELMVVEEHPTVFQLVSTVRGRLAAGVTPMECVRALFPGGSMTGAPKIRTMKYIAQLEERPRGVYSGAFGYFAASGAMDLGMTIRTLVLREREMSFGVGGAIVADSDPVAEHDEIVAKAYALMRAVLLAERGQFRDEDIDLS